MPDPQPQALHQPTRHPSRPSAGSPDTWPTSLAPSLASGGLLACHGVHRPQVPRAGQTARPGNPGGQRHDRGSHELRRQLTEDPEVRYTDGGIARAMFRVAVSGRREQEASFFTAVVWRDQADPADPAAGRLLDRHPGAKAVVAPLFQGPGRHLGHILGGERLAEDDVAGDLGIAEQPRQLGKVVGPPRSQQQPGGHDRGHPQDRTPPAAETRRRSDARPSATAARAAPPAWRSCQVSRRTADLSHETRRVGGQPVGTANRLMARKWAATPAITSRWNTSW